MENTHPPLPTAGQKRKQHRYDKPMEYTRGNNKAKTKVGIHDLIKKHFTNGILKANPSLRFMDLASFCNVHT